MEQYAHTLLEDEPRHTVDSSNPFAQIEVSLSVAARKTIALALYQTPAATHLHRLLWYCSRSSSCILHIVAQRTNAYMPNVGSQLQRPAMGNLHR